MTLRKARHTRPFPEDLEQFARSVEQVLEHPDSLGLPGLKRSARPILERRERRVVEEPTSLTSANNVAPQHGPSRSTPVTDAEIERLVDEAESGCGTRPTPTSPNHGDRWLVMLRVGLNDLAGNRNRE